MTSVHVVRQPMRIVASSSDMARSPGMAVMSSTSAWAVCPQASRPARAGKMSVPPARIVSSRPARRPFPEHLPRERVVIPAPESCPCCGSTRLSKLGEDVTETLEGRYTRLCYSNPDGRSVFEVYSNYRNALASRGLQIEYECSGPAACSNFNVRGVALSDVMKIGRFQSSNQRDQRYLTGRLARDGGTTFVSLQTYPPYTLVHVVETNEMDTGMVSVNANALSEGLERDGKVTLEGIHFDTGRDTLRSESDAALAQVGLLLRDQPALKLLVVGHTDSTGSADANVRLSQRRAERVRDALVTRYGVTPARLTAQGLGAARPVASNGTEHGRQQNRRVELVRR